MSERHVKVISDAIKRVPEKVRGIVSRYGGEVVAIRSIKDVPDISEGKAEFGETAGLFDPETKKAYLPELSAKGRRIDSWWTGSMDVGGVARHEYGHMADAALGDVSLSPEFKAAYEADKSKLGWWAKRKLAYFLQEGDDGLQEAFAEVFADLYGGSPEGTQASKHFPQVAALIKGLAG